MVASSMTHQGCQKSDWQTRVVVVGFAGSFEGYIVEARHGNVSCGVV